MRPTCQHKKLVTQMDLSVVYVDVITYKCATCGAMRGVPRTDPGAREFKVDPVYEQRMLDAQHQALGHEPGTREAA